MSRGAAFSHSADSLTPNSPTYNLIFSERNKAAVREEGGVGDLVEAMRMHKEHTGVSFFYVFCMHVVFLDQSVCLLCANMYGRLARTHTHNITICARTHTTNISTCKLYKQTQISRTASFSFDTQTRLLKHAPGHHGRACAGGVRSARKSG